MVSRSSICLPFLIFPGLAAAQESPQDQMFPGPEICYARSYTADHLAAHPAQRTTAMSISPDFAQSSPSLAVRLLVKLRGMPGGRFEAHAICDNQGASTLYCGMEGDAGGFQITPAKGGAVLISVSSLGMTFENETGFVTLERTAGDDRSFLLRPTSCR